MPYPSIFCMLFPQQTSTTQVRTANTVIPTGITAYETEPIFTGNILDYNGTYYRIGEGQMEFDFLDSEHPFYELSFRIARILLPNGNYECLITNLDRKEFSAEKLKTLYKMRWRHRNIFPKTEIYDRYVKPS